MGDFNGYEWAELFLLFEKETFVFRLICFYFSVFFALFAHPVGAQPAGAQSATAHAGVRVGHLSGGWYRQEKNVLTRDIQNYFSTAQEKFPVFTDRRFVKALIVPHAGHSFSGLCAASAYQSIIGAPIKRVIILAPSHRTAFSGVALPDYNTYRTVLGDISVDKAAIDSLKEEKLFGTVPKVHSVEHSVEIQLPFLQFCLKKFSIVPLIIGSGAEGDTFSNSDCEKIANSLSKIIDDKTLVVVSSDFTHYGPNYSYFLSGEVPKSDVLLRIKRLDSRAIGMISKKSFNEFDAFLKRTKATICGRNAIKILLKLFEKDVFKHLSCKLASYYTSVQLERARKEKGSEIDVKKLLQDIPDKEIKNSVSYAGLIFTQEKLSSLPFEKQLTGYEKLALLKLARDFVQHKLRKSKREDWFLYPIVSDGLFRKAGVFVTINKNGNLRGCIGRIIAHESLYKTVAEMAIASAFDDKRFSPLKKDELEKVVFDITVLTPPRRISRYKRIVIGRHGIILKKFMPDGSMKSAVFLPKVPIKFKWDLKTTLEHLSVKAGLLKDGYKKGCIFEVFEGFEFSES
jgi:AmmeMemoRadiSam system protein B/AmmeMemoRadiSam system protein A